MSEDWERLPSMQRMITSDDVIYVHQNPKRQRRSVVVAEPEPAVAVAHVAEPEVMETEVAPEPIMEEWGSEPVDVVPEATPEPEVAQPVRTKTIVRSSPVAPPPGYAVEFGTGRLVKIHSYKGRMSYPSSGW